MQSFEFALLPCLEAIISEVSVTGAARRLGRSQPAISRELARLRFQLGDPIIVRTSAGMQLTPRAEAMAVEMREAMASLRSLVNRDASFDPGSDRATFRISLGDYEAALLLPRVLAELARSAPHVRLSIVHRRRPDVEHALNSGEVDLAVGRLVRPGNLLFRTPLFTDEFSVGASLQHPSLERLHEMSVLLQQRFVLIAPGGTGEMKGLFDDALSSLGARRGVVLSIPHFLLLPQILKGGDLVTIAPTHLLNLLADCNALSVIPSPVAQAGFEIDMLWHQRTDRNPGSKWLRQRFVDAALALKLNSA